MNEGGRESRCGTVKLKRCAFGPRMRSWSMRVASMIAVRANSISVFSGGMMDLVGPSISKDGWLSPSSLMNLSILSVLVEIISANSQIVGDMVLFSESCEKCQGNVDFCIYFLPSVNFSNSLGLIKFMVVYIR